MRRLWLLFAQTVTVCLAILFIVATLRPEWLHNEPVAPVHEAPVPVEPIARAAPQWSFAEVVARATPSVVNVYTRKHVNVPLLPLPPDPALEQLFRDVPGFSRRKESTNLGSGVIVRDDGYILTNNHVIEAADSIEVALSDGREAKAVLVGADPESDLAVLRIDLPKLQAIAFNGERPARTGDVVLAIGNPFGVGQTTTMGIISAVGRNRVGINTYENFIQTDAAINPGNSGGALIDTAGRLVGINTAIYSETGGSLGIGFAIPAQAAHKIMAQIIATGVVTRGWLGVEPQDITPDLSRAFNLKLDHGVIVASVLRKGPAWEAGVRVGDIILKMDGAQVYDAIGFLNQIAPLEPGQETQLEVLRGGKKLQLTAKVGTRPPIRRR